MSSMLNQRYTLAKLREELKERKGKLCLYSKKFGHLAQNCRNKKREKRRKSTPQNKFEVLTCRVMRCGVKVRRQKTIEKKEI